MPDLELIERFLDAIRDKRDADEFERLTIGSVKRTSDEVWESIHTSEELSDAGGLFWDGGALAELKGRRGVEALQARFPELWEQVVMSEFVDA